MVGIYDQERQHSVSFANIFCEQFCEQFSAAVRWRDSAGAASLRIVVSPSGQRTAPQDPGTIAKSSSRAASTAAGGLQNCATYQGEDLHKSPKGEEDGEKHLGGFPVACLAQKTNDVD
jgi:hypothetical protein